MTAEERRERALKTHSGAIHTFARIGRWGTCGDCPRDSRGYAYPEFCVNTGRYDHHLDMKSLSEQWYHTYTC
jgi:hypothetical protein